MTDDWVSTTVAPLPPWAAAHGAEVDAGDAAILLGLAAEIGVTGPAEMGPGELRRVLLERFPDQVAVDPEDAPHVLRTAAALVDFLEDTAVIDAGPAALLRAELDGAGEEFTEAVTVAHEADQRVAAEIVDRMMADEGVDLDDEAAVRAWVAAFSALPEAERDARAQPYLEVLGEEPGAEELWVPPVRLPQRAELAGPARESSLYAEAVALAEWTGQGRPVDDDWMLGPEDAATARTEFGLDDVTLDRLWSAAVAAELIVIDEEALRTDLSPLLLTLPAEDPLGVLLDLFDAAVTPVEDGHRHDLGPADAVHDALPGVLLHLYEQETPATHDELAGALIDHLLVTQDVPGGKAGAWREEAETAFDAEAARLVHWGIAEIGPGGHTLTPLGLWAVRELLLADGYLAPVVGELAEAPAREFVMGLTLHRDGTAGEEIALWLAARDPAEAAAELLAVMDAGTPGARNLAAAVLHHVGPAAEPAVRAGLNAQPTRPYAALWLHGQGLAGEPEPGDLTWVFVDTVAGLLETGDEAAAIATALAGTPVDVDMQVIAEEMWRADHPDVVEVLEALGTHHEDRQVAKAARRAAHRARSARDGS